MTYKLLDLFSGIGGFSLGLERTGGFETVAFCEIEDFPRRVLAKHWPEVPCYGDIRELTADRLAADGITVDAICGGFPCQDLSVSGRRRGLDGERSGLWTEFARLIDELRPQVAFVENVTGLLTGPDARPGGWFGRVLGDLAEIGYDAEWHCISAFDAGLEHVRPRVWVMAYPHQANAADKSAASPIVTLPKILKQRRRGSDELGASHCVQRCDSYDEIRRVVYGLPDWVASVGALGNAVVPQIPELIGRAWLEAVRKSEAA